MYTPRYMTDREYEERYGVMVGYCSIHKHKIVDSCDDCYDDLPKCSICLEVNPDEENDICRICRNSD